MVNFAQQFMKHILLPVLATVFLISSCSKAVPPMSKGEVRRKIDSAVKASVQQSDEAARIDLERRMKIEVKVMVDSMVHAHQRTAPVNNEP